MPPRADWSWIRLRERAQRLGGQDDHVLGDQPGAADEGEAGGELVLLEAAGFPAEVAQGDAQQAGGEFDALGVAADPEQLLGDAAGDFRAPTDAGPSRGAGFSRPCGS